MKKVLKITALVIALAVLVFSAIVFINGEELFGLVGGIGAGIILIITRFDDLEDKIDKLSG